MHVVLLCGYGELERRHCKPLVGALLQNEADHVTSGMVRTGFWQIHPSIRGYFSSVEQNRYSGHSILSGGIVPQTYIQEIQGTSSLFHLRKLFYGWIFYLNVIISLKRHIGFAQWSARIRFAKVILAYTISIKKVIHTAKTFCNSRLDLLSGFSF